MLKRAHSGFSLVELMIAVTIAMGLSVAVMYIYAGQIRTFSQVARKQQTSQEARTAFEIVSNLVRQADLCLSVDTQRCPAQLTLAMTYPAGVSNPNSTTTLQAANDSIRIDFVVPAGYDIWPNSDGTTAPPYASNAIRITWSSADGIVWVSNGANVADAEPRANRIALAGANGSLNTRVINLDLWPQVVTAGVVTDAVNATDKPTAGYRLSMTSRVGTADSTYTNTLDQTNALGLQHYRTVTYQRTVIPRNW